MWLECCSPWGFFKDIDTYRSSLIYAGDPSKRMTIFCNIWFHRGKGGSGAGNTLERRLITLCLPCLHLVCEDCPGGPVVKTLHFHCRGRSFNPLWGNKDPTWHAAQKKGKKKTVWSTPHNFTSMHNYAKEFPGGLVAKTALPMQGNWVQFLVEDLFHYRPWAWHTLLVKFLQKTVWEFLKNLNIELIWTQQ